MQQHPRFLLILSVLFLLCGKTPGQTLRGTVVDRASGSPLPFVLLTVPDAHPFLSTYTDSLGRFSFERIPPGRYTLNAGATGYESLVLPELLVGAAKETILTITMKEVITKLGEVVVKWNYRGFPLNEMTTVSSQPITVEIASRYAGGFDDPARMASAFAGVAGNTEQNGLIVRGNAPRLMQWKMEGVEIPNPSHFADLNLFGGGTLTALSSQMLANSEFLTGAFPAEYNNALAGVMDMSMKTGNNQKYEHTFQAGVIGIDASSEGPVTKEKKSSYAFNYRYSTLALLAPLLPDNAGGMRYQDVSFKFHFPSQKAGVFSIWGIGLADRASAQPKADSTLRRYSNDYEADLIKQQNGVFGLSHYYSPDPKRFIKTTLAATGSTTDWATQRLDPLNVLRPKNRIYALYSNYILTSFINTKFNARHTNRTGITLTGMHYRIQLNHSLKNAEPPAEIVNASGFSTLITAYSSSSVDLHTKFRMTVGVNGQFFTLNSRYTVEPRLGFRYDHDTKQAFSLAYGLHSRLEKLNYFFSGSRPETNRNLDFTRAHHLVAGYDLQLSPLVRFRTETYWQSLFSVPVMADSSFSLTNLQNDWFFKGDLHSNGRGRNYGIDLSLDRRLSNGFYYLVTASLFRSQYRGGDTVWRSTRFNRSFVFNLLTGKEWKVGKRRRNLLGLNGRITYQGGNRYSPVNQAASHFTRSIVYDENSAFSEQSQSILHLHITASLKINGTKTSREVALKVLNLTGAPDFYGFRYNLPENKIEKNLASVTIPNLSYKICF